MSQPGIGVMIGLLGGNEETVNAIKSSLGKKIKNVQLEADDTLKFEFQDGSSLNIRDDGQSCCEHRYMTTDDDLSEYSGATLLDFELKNAPDQEDEWGEVHEVQFLDVKTDKGVFQMANHNEHNGYYGGFWIVATN
jgi:hypothetical protein